VPDFKTAPLWFLTFKENAGTQAFHLATPKGHS
jgi:hypothetical protein